MKKIIATLLTVVLLLNTSLCFNVFSKNSRKTLRLNEECTVTVDIDKQDTFDFIFTASKRGLYNLNTNDDLLMCIEDVECDNDEVSHVTFDFYEDFVLNAGQSIRFTISFSDSDTYSLEIVNSDNLYYYDTTIYGDEIYLKGYFGDEETVIVPDYIEGIPVTYIEYACFYDCPTIKTVVFSNTIEVIDDQVFIDCPNLHTLHFSSSVGSVGITEDSIIGKNCPNVSVITIDENNPYYESRGNCNAIIDSERNALRLGCKNTLIPEDVEHIFDGAFRNCVALTTINIPASVQTIGFYSFLNCTSLTDVYLTKNTSFISHQAFDNCKSLKNVYFYGSFDDWKKIEIMSGNDALLNAQIHYMNDNGEEYSSKIIQPTSTKLGYVLFTEADGSTYKKYFTSPTGKISGYKCKSRTAAAETVNWNNVKTATGYQVQISTKDGKKWDKYYNLKAGVTSYTFKSLAAGNNYKFRVRFYIKAADGKNYYSPWSATLTSPTLPAGTTLSKLTVGKKAFTVLWKKNKAVTGYQIQYSTKSRFSGAKTVTFKSNKTLKATVKKLSAKKVYYVRIRAYKTISKVNYFSNWSKTYKVKTK